MKFLDKETWPIAKTGTLVLLGKRTNLLTNSVYIGQSRLLEMWDVAPESRIEDWEINEGKDDQQKDAASCES